MAKIYSNMFTFNESDEIEIKNNLEESIDVKSLYKDYSVSFLEELRKVLKTCGTHEVNTFEEFDVTYSNFQQYHFDIMNNLYLLVLFDYNNNLYKYILPSGKIFSTSDKKVIDIIHSVPTPIKFTYTSIPLHSSKNVISFKMLTTVLFNIRHNSLEKIISEFTKETAIVNSNSENTLLIHLYKIYPKIAHIITKHNYWKYIHMENAVYYSSRQRETIFNEEDILFIKNTLKTQENSLISLCNDLNIDKSVLSSKSNILKHVALNTNNFPSINENVLAATNNTSWYELMKVFNSLKPLPKIDTYNIIGSCSAPSIYFNTTDKELIRCTYVDMYFKILAMLSYNKDLIKLSNTGSVVTQLLKDCTTLIDNNIYLTVFLCAEYIKCIVLGLKTDKEIVSYFEKVLNIVLIKTNLIIIKELYKNELKLISNAINHFNESNYANSDTYLITHKITTPLHKAIYTYIRLINKTLINDLTAYCNEFNIKNKVKFNLYHFNSEEIYILADTEALDVAMDTATRIMPVTFSHFTPSIIPEIAVHLVDKVCVEEVISAEEVSPVNDELNLDEQLII